MRFVNAVNLHWPDTIYTYLEDEDILFTNDSFGSHYCDPKVFDDQVGDFTAELKYYFDVILRPFSKHMLTAIERIEPLKIKTICTGHGPVLRSKWKEAIALTKQWAQEYVDRTNVAKEKILIAYISAYGYTKIAVDEIMRGIKETCNYQVDVVDIEHSRPEDMQQLLIDHGHILLGSPTINQNSLPPIYNFLSIVDPIRDHGKTAGSFGSYGWSGEATKIIDANLKLLKFNLVQDPAVFKFFPSTKEKIERLYNFGKKFGEACCKRQ